MINTAVLTDVHANLPALVAALEDIRQQQVDAVIHTGDLIAIGPHPAECLEQMLALPRVHFTLGNHDDYFLHGLPQPQPEWMGDGEVQHQKWTHRQLDDVQRIVMAQWPYVINQELEGVRVTYTHYARQPGKRDFAPIIRNPTVSDLDNMLGHYRSDLVFYGHDHAAADITGQCRYVNPGSLGCSRKAVACYVLLACEAGNFELEILAVPYDDASLFDAYARRRVPERDFLCRVFHGNRRPLPRIPSAANL